MDRRRIGRIDLRGNEAIIEVLDDWQGCLVQGLDGQTSGLRRVRVWAESAGEAAAVDGDHFEKRAGRAVYRGDFVGPHPNLKLCRFTYHQSKPFFKSERRNGL